jgi:hypothetical protein
MSSIIEFNGRKYDSLTGKVLSSAVGGQQSGLIDVKKVFKPAAKSMNGIVGEVKKVEIRSDFKSAEPTDKPKTAHRESIARHRRVESPKTLMRTAVKKPKHKLAPEHKPSPRVGLYKELTRERARRARHISKSSSVTKFSKSHAQRKSDITFTAKPLPVATQPPRTLTDSVVTQTEHLAEQLEHAVQSAESHMEVFAEDKLKSRKSRKFAYAFASFTSVLLIGFAIYQAVPFAQVKLASNKAGFSAALPGYVPSGYGLENNLQSDSGVVTMTYSSEADNRNYKITQTPSRWNSDSLLNNYVLPAGSQYERIDKNGQTIYLYDAEKSATWLDNGIWYRLDGADNFSNDQLIRIVQGL